MKQKIVAAFICLIMICIFPSIKVYADTGPKPSIHVKFKNMGDEVCYGTLLSQEPSTGPASVWDGKEIPTVDNLKVWRAFVDYEDIDGFYFLQKTWFCSETKAIDWTYYPPSPFKVLLYYPEKNVFVVSEICEKYAFNSYFKVNMGEIDIDTVTASDVSLSVEKEYSYGWEVFALICRVIFSTIIEILFACIFAFNTKRLIGLIIGTNIGTQIILNLLLNTLNYRRNGIAYSATYLGLEIVVMVIEIIVYLVMFRRISHKEIPTADIVTYTVIANLLSLLGGAILGKFVPSIF